MARSRFVSQQTVRLDISDGDWIEIKQRLSYGDEIKLQTAGIAGVDAGALFNGTDAATRNEDDRSAEARLDMQKWVVEQLIVWIVDWSFRDDNDKPVRVTRDAIKQLDPDTAAEVQAALGEYVKKLQEEKKLTLTK